MAKASSLGEAPFPPGHIYWTFHGLDEKREAIERLRLELTESILRERREAQESKLKIIHAFRTLGLANGKYTIQVAGGEIEFLKHPNDEKVQNALIVDGIKFSSAVEAYRVILGREPKSKGNRPWMIQRMRRWGHNVVEIR